MKQLNIDIETYSSAPLPDCGVYKYAESEDFQVLLFAYAADGGEVRVIDLARGEQLPEDVRRALTDPEVRKCAYNAQFERVCLSRYLGLPTGEYLDPAQWHCTMVNAARLGYPFGLAACASAMGSDTQKMKEGAALIRKFSVPISTPKRKGEQRRPEDDPEAWELFKAYCKQDVETEMSLQRLLERYPEPCPFDRALQIADARINDRGVRLNLPFATAAEALDRALKEDITREMQTITGNPKPNAPGAIKEYIKRTTGTNIDSLRKSELKDTAKAFAMYPSVVRLLQLREEAGKTSTKKYKAMLDCVCRDGRIRGLLQFYGAARTGRWAGRLVQLQNIPANKLCEIDSAREDALTMDAEEFALSYAKPLDTLSQLIRTAFVASNNNALYICDFSAIEARVVAWLAGQKWVLDVFKEGGDIYCATASKMFGVPVVKGGENAELRQKGKVATLALGYGGGTAALEAMGAAKMGLTYDEQLHIVRLWRRANDRIVDLWSTLERAAKAAIISNKTFKVHQGIRVGYLSGALFIELPSKRQLYYPEAKIAQTGAGEEITYKGQNQTTKKWEVVKTYGGKLTENVVQAVARDILGEVILKLEAAGLQTIFHVHDETICDTAHTGEALHTIKQIFSQTPAWAEGLPLSGEGFASPYYKKD